MSSSTIAAVATPHGRGGIAVIRLSGRDARAIAMRLCSATDLPPRKAVYCHFTHRGQYIDDGIATYFPAPHSYTGEDCVELSCHGSAYVQQAMLDALIDCGAQMATAGEYTMRAFANGKLNLSQAEAVADLIDAITPAQHRLAVSQLRGGYAEQLKRLRQSLVEAAALMELELDFSQEDVHFADRAQLLSTVDAIATDAQRLANSFSAGNALRNGIPVAIVGEPNAGKSSLLNALVGDDRAIVSPVAGTTRDTVEDTLYIGGTLFRFVDTAGLRHTTDSVEALGIERSRRAMATASIILYVHDATKPYPEALPHILPEQQMLFVCNKADLLPYPPTASATAAQCHVSATTGYGIGHLRDMLSDMAARVVNGAGDVLVSNPRHRDALLRLCEALGHVREGIDMALPTDLVAVDLRDALYHLGTITGDVANDELLSTIFARFCIGK